MENREFENAEFISEESDGAAGYRKAGIVDDNITDAADVENEENVVRFEEIGISPEILRALDDMGFTAATPIQSQAIPVVMQGGDVIGQAQTGTGKTCAYGIPAIATAVGGIPEIVSNENGFLLTVKERADGK